MQPDLSLQTTTSATTHQEKSINNQVTKYLRTSSVFQVMGFWHGSLPRRRVGDAAAIINHCPPPNLKIDESVTSISVVMPSSSMQQQHLTPPSTPKATVSINFFESESSTSSCDSDSSECYYASAEGYYMHGPLSVRDDTVTEPVYPPTSCMVKDSDTIQTTTKKKKRVTFGNIEFRKYPIILGDHPDCTIGPPLTIGWEYQKKSIVVPVDYWEANRTPRRHCEDLVTTMKHRVTILRNVATPEEMKNAILEVRSVQRQRELSCRRYQYMVMGNQRSMMMNQNPVARCLNMFGFCFSSGRPPSSPFFQNNQLLLVPTQGNGAASFASS